MVVVVHPGLPTVEVWWRNPFGASVFAFSGLPAARFDQAVVLGTSQGEVVDVGLTAIGPVVDTVLMGNNVPPPVTA